MTKQQRIQAITQGFKHMSTEAVMLHQVIAERLGLHLTDHKAMDFLYRFGALTAGELAKYTGLTTGAITGVVDRLELAGYVRRVNDPDDRRRKVIELTHNQELEKNLQSIFRTLEEHTHTHMEKYSDKELDFILEFLRHSAEIVKEHRNNLRGQ